MGAIAELSRHQDRHQGPIREPSHVAVSLTVVERPRHLPVIEASVLPEMRIPGCQPRRDVPRQG